MTVSREGGSDTNPETRILIVLARIEERQNSLVDANKSAQSAAEARHTNIMQAIATFVPRSEIDKDNKAIHERIDGVEKRLERWTSGVGAVAAAVTALGSVVLTKVGLLHCPRVNIRQHPRAPRLCAGRLFRVHSPPFPR